MPIHIVGPDNRGFLKARAMCGDIVLGPQVGGHSVAHDDRDKGTCHGCRAAAGLPLVTDATVEVRGAVARGVMPAGHEWFIDHRGRQRRFVSTGQGEEIAIGHARWMPSLNQLLIWEGDRLPDDPPLAVVTFRDSVDRSFTITYLKPADQ